MDTSSNQKNSSADTIEPTVVDYLITSNRRIVTTDLPLETWVYVVRRLIDQCKPYLKYFHGFKELGQTIDQDWWKEIAFKHQGRSITFHKGVTNKTRVMNIIRFSDGLHAWWDKNIFVTYKLLLTDKGVIILGTLRKDRADWPLSDRSMMVEFEEVDDEKLAHLIFESHGRITDLAESLKEVLIGGIKRREQQLESLREILTTVARFNNLLDLRVICKKCKGSKERFGFCPHCEKNE